MKNFQRLESIQSPVAPRASAKQLEALAPSLIPSLVSAILPALLPLTLMVLTLQFGLKTLEPIQSATKSTIMLVSEALRYQAPARSVPLLTVASVQPQFEFDRQQMQYEDHPMAPHIRFVSQIVTRYQPTTADPHKLARHIVEVSLEENVDPFYVAAVIAHESSFHPLARSHKGAMGLMQLMPRTADEVWQSVRSDDSSPQLTDPRTNLVLGINYLKRLERRYRGNRFNALAAYNWGLTNVDAVLRGKKTMPRAVKRYADQIIAYNARLKRQYTAALAREKRLADAIALKPEEKTVTTSS